METLLQEGEQLQAAKKDDPAHRARQLEQQKVEEHAMKQKRDSQRKRKVAILNAMFESTLEDLSWPHDIDEATKSFVTCLLKLDPHERLGHFGPQEVKAHRFFKGFSWEKLLKKHLVPPFVPSSHVVHADYVEPPDTRTAKKKYPFFEDFDYVAPMALQNEIMNSMHDIDDLINYRKHPKRKVSN